MTLISQQIEWLERAYKPLLAIALRITGNAEMAEEAVSDSVTSGMEQIVDGKCRADEFGRFCAWIRKIVRLRCYSRLKQGSQDIPTDRGAEALRYELRPDRRRAYQGCPDEESWVATCYVRSEDVE